VVVAPNPTGPAISGTNNGENPLGTAQVGVYGAGGVGVSGVGQLGGMFFSQLGQGLSARGYGLGISGACASSACTAVNGIGTNRGGIGLYGVGTFGVIGKSVPSEPGFKSFRPWAGYFVGDVSVSGSLEAPIIQQQQSRIASLESDLASLRSQVAALVAASGTPGIIPHTIPSRIEAEDYDAGGQGVGYSDSTQGNEQGFTVYRNDDVDIKTSQEGGYAIGWMTAGEWLAYTVNVPADGLYDFAFRIGSVLNSRMYHIEVDGQNITGELEVPRMADWDQYNTLTRTGVALHAGRQTLKLVVDSDYFDFQWFEITPH